jgi:hypothetical protein
MKRNLDYRKCKTPASEQKRNRAKGNRKPRRTVSRRPGELLINSVRGVFYNFFRYIDFEYYYPAQQASPSMDGTTALNGTTEDCKLFSFCYRHLPTTTRNFESRAKKQLNGSAQAKKADSTRTIHDGCWLRFRNVCSKLVSVMRFCFSITIKWLW